MESEHCWLPSPGILVEFRKMPKLETNFLRHSLEASVGVRSLKHPLLVYLYLTYRCNLACSYCDDGTGTAYPQRKRGGEMSTAEVVRLLRLLRRETDGLVITGGEPTVRRDLEEVLAGAKALGYRLVTLLTNGKTLDTRLGVLRNTDILMISLDTVDEERADAIFNSGPGVTRRILGNIELALSLRHRMGYRLFFSVCVTPETVGDVQAVIDFAIARKTGFIVLPALYKGRASPGLKGCSEYLALIDRVIAMKRGGFPVLGSMAYYRCIRDFTSFDCQPLLLARVKPDGTLLYPCNNINLEGGNLLELGSFDAAVQEALRRHGGVPAGCGARCHEGCYMDFSSCVQQPLLSFEEAYYRGKSWIMGRLTSGESDRSGRWA